MPEMPLLVSLPLAETAITPLQIFLSLLVSLAGIGLGILLGRIAVEELAGARKILHAVVIMLSSLSLAVVLFFFFMVRSYLLLAVLVSLLFAAWQLSRMLVVQRIMEKELFFHGIAYFLLLLCFGVGNYLSLSSKNWFIFGAAVFFLNGMALGAFGYARRLACGSEEKS